MRKTASERNKSAKKARRSATPSPNHIIADTLLEPWFLNMETARAVQCLIPRKYFYRMRWVFDDFGCLRCRTKKSGYGGNGFCLACRCTVLQCIVRSIRKRSKNLDNRSTPVEPRGYVDRVEAAERLLGDLAASGL